MGELPSGTVTFLFTDLEGSTRLWEEHAEAMQGALARHDELVRAAIDSQDGHVVKTTGDGFHAAFSTAHDAVVAAIEAQRALATESWTDTGALRVRMGIHTGEARHRDGDYYGTALNRAARLTAIAHAGQLLVSDATERLLDGGSETTFDLLDLGEHRLRDLTQASRIYQVCAPGLEREFAPLRSLDAFPGNLPVQLTSFVGRTDELTALIEMMGASRLVTLTGVGGVGKTRLALQAAAELLPNFQDGVWFCDLATASDETLMFQAVADAVGARQREGMSLADSIAEFLRDRAVLIVLDNCEHLLADAAWLASEILQRDPQVRILATSREGLGVAGEQLVALPSLSVPSASDDVDSAGTSEAVRLFADRAVGARPGFALGSSNVTAVSEICRRLDGMPLAIELAAARVTAMSPAEIAARLDERFRLLTGGRRSRVERHQTLRATVEWSYSLLETSERLVFNRLGVFVGSFDAASAEAVVADAAVEHWDVHECLTGLVEKSMALAEHTDDGTTRYRLLETLRAFAREQLDSAAETDTWRRRHAGYYADFSELAGPELMGADEFVWARRIEVELDNLRAALKWGLDAPAQADADLALRIIIALMQNVTRNRWDLGGWAEALLPRAQTSLVSGRAGVIAGAASWLMLHDDSDAAEQLALEAINMTAVDDALPLAWAYFVLGSARIRQGRMSDALDALNEGHALLQAGGAAPRYHTGLHGLASLVYLIVGDMDAARREADSNLEIARASGNPSLLVGALMYKGRAWFSAEPAAALAAFEESIALARAGASDSAHTIALGGAAQLHARAGDRSSALDLLRTAVGFDHDVGTRAGLGLTIERAIATLASLGEDALAATCVGIVQSQTVTAFRSLPQTDRIAARVADRMGAAAYEVAFARGTALAYEEVAPTLIGELDRLLLKSSDALRLIVCEHMFVCSEATILHADLDAFYASVEQRRPLGCAAGPVIVGAGVVLSSSYEARACGVRTAMGGRPGPPAVPAGDRGRRPHVGLLRGEQGGVRGVRADDAAGRGLSIDEAFLDVGGLRRVSARPPRSRCGCGATCSSSRAADHGRRGHGPSSSPRWPAAWPSPTVCWWCRPTASSPFSIRCPVSGSGASGRRPRTSSTSAGSPPSARSPSSPERPWSRCSGRRPADTCTPSRTTSIPGRWRWGAAGVRSGRSTRSAERRGHLRPSTPWSSPWSTASPAGCGPPGGRPHRRAPVALRRLLARRARTLSQATAQTQPILDAVRALLATAMPMIERQGLTLVGLAVGNLDDDDAIQLALPLDRHSGGALDAALDDVRDRFGSAAVTRAVLLGRDQGLSVPLLPDPPIS